MNIFLPDSFCSFSRQRNSRSPTKTASPQASACLGAEKWNKQHGQNAAADQVANKIFYNFTENAEDITAVVRITPQTDFFSNCKNLKQECILRKTCSIAAVHSNQSENDTALLKDCKLQLILVENHRKLCFFFFFLFYFIFILFLISYRPRAKLPVWLHVKASFQYKIQPASSLQNSHT